MPLLFILGAFVSGAMFAGRAHAEALKTQQHRDDVHAKLDSLNKKVAVLETENTSKVA